MAAPIRRDRKSQKSVRFNYRIEAFSRVVIAVQEPRRGWTRNVHVSNFENDPDPENPTGRVATHELTDMQIHELAVISKNPSEFIRRINNRSFNENHKKHTEPPPL